MEMMYPNKRRKRTSPYDDGTSSYASTNVGPPELQPATLSNTGVDTTTPGAHSPSTNMYWNSQTADRQGYREEGQKQYGLGSEYYKGLDDAGKQAFTQKFATNQAGKGVAGAGLGSGPKMNPLATPKADLQTQARFKAAAGADAPVANDQQEFGPASGMKGASAIASARTSQAADQKQRMTDRAYQAAAKNAYSLQQIKDPALLGQLGKADPHHEWREVYDNVTGKSLGYYQDDMKSGRGGGLKQNWERNQPAWQAGIGAVTGLVTGGPAGAVIGGAAGFASGKKQQDAQKAQRLAQRAQNKYDLKNSTQNLGLRDVARSRAAGAGTFNYTDSVGG
jgi:hypothetical protein